MFYETASASTAKYEVGWEHTLVGVRLDAGSIVAGAFSGYSPQRAELVVEIVSGMRRIVVAYTHCDE